MSGPTARFTASVIWRRPLPAAAPFICRRPTEKTARCQDTGSKLPASFHGHYLTASVDQWSAASRSDVSAKAHRRGLMRRIAIITAFAIVGALMSACSAGGSQHERTPSCPSAETVRHVLENQDYWRHMTFTVSPNVSCVGPYVVAGASNSSGSGARVLLEQKVTGLRFLVSGSGPICTIVRSDAEAGQLVYIPPRYGHALLCLNGKGMA